MPVRGLKQLVNSRDKRTWTRADLAQYMREELGLSRRESLQIVNGFFALIGEQLVAGNQVSLVGMGQFLSVQRMGRIGRNPRTGESYPVPARRTVVFRTGARLKRKLAGTGS